MVDIVPIDVPEKRMAHDLLGVGDAGAETDLGFARQEFLQDGDGVARHVDGVEGLVGENGVVDLVFVFAAEGRLLQEHLVDQHAEGPPVDCAAVFLVEEDLVEEERVSGFLPLGLGEDTVRVGRWSRYLWCHEFGCAAEGAGGGVVPHVLFAETIVGNLDVAVEGQEDVVELEIAVDDPVLVEVL